MGLVFNEPFGERGIWYSQMFITVIYNIFIILPNLHNSVLTQLMQISQL